MKVEKKILITGGTGTTGSRIAKRLVRSGAGVRIASRRMPAMAGTEHVYFDWNDQKTYRDALKNTNSLYLVAPVGVFEPSPLVVPFLEMAAASGVRRIVLLSAAIIDEDGPVFGKLHHAVRRYVPEWTVLKPSYFMQNFDHQHGASIRKKNEIVTASGSGKVGFIDADDIAEVAVRALLDQKPHNTSHILTGPEALSYAEAAAIIGRAAGRDVRHVNVEVSALRERYIKAGLSPDYAGFMSDLDEKIKNGKENRITDTVERITGKKPRSLADFANEHAGRWRLL
ncbi:NmrA family NAD(P)-binding protein [Bacillus paralicheniformis]|uniref:NmrA family NAD(P)-binding protein n=1 Tax=Bacillus paralicheniformis TaxID=1648923 RepID=UPI0018994DF5|nr:NAD(P)H-binding protein [Bacillus paralicheniformis]